MTNSFGLLMLAVCSAVSAYGQASAINAEMVGTVSDPSGAPVPGAQVTGTNVDTGYRQSARTNEAGLYRLPLLPLGRYEVVAEMSGFARYRQSGIALTAGAIATVDIRLQVSGVATEVSVTAAAPIVDPSRTDQGSSLGDSAIRNLPLVSRNPYNFILQQPNVSGRGNTEFGVPRKVNANGFAGRINYMLDGSNNVQSDRAGIRLMPMSNTWVQEVQQVSNGFAPEFGNTVGTVFNAVTKSGANDLHGEAGYLFRRTPMSARPALLAVSRPAPDVNVDSWLADAGWRIVRDRVFFFAAFEKVKRDLPAPVTVASATIAQLGLPASFADPIPFRQNIAFALGKLDLQLGSSNRMALRYNHHRNDSPYNSSTIGGLFLVDRTYNFVDRSHGGALQLISTFSASAVNELRIQVPFRTQQQNRFEATGTGPAITIPGVANFGNSLDVGFIYDEMTPEVSDNFSYISGTHAWKFGAAVRSIRDTKVQNTSANYTFPSTGAYLAAKSGQNPRGYTTFTQTVGDPAITYKMLFTSVYAQDSWKPAPNMTLMYGLRYDLYRPPRAREDSPFQWSRQFRIDKNNFAPRLGIALGFGRTVLRASAGIFYDPFQTDMYRSAILNNGTPQFFGITVTPDLPNAPAFPSVFSGIPSGFTRSVQDITTVSPDFANLYSVNANTTLAHAFSDNLGVEATYLYTRGNRLPVYRNINLIPSGRRLADLRPIFSTARIHPNFGSIVAAESVGQSTYSGLNLTIRRRFAYGFEIFATYTWSHAIDDAPEQNNIDASNFMPSDPMNRRRDRGNSWVDRRHVFNGNALIRPSVSSGSRVVDYLVNNNRLALTATIQSGDVQNMGSNMNLNQDPATPTAFQRPLHIGRNTLRVLRTAELNARFSRLFPIRDRMDFEFFAESTNVLNRTNVTGMNTTAGVNAAGAIIARPSLAWTSALDQ
ncbi:MAG TPA: TonB-dependent receptor, partial [Bryobacteraceae bacterium]|nr:TonB-dependent receptor [Bryobacteraceae bacterium]